MLLSCAQRGRTTALMFAADDGHTDCVRLLINAGADKNLADIVRDMFPVAWVSRIGFSVAVECPVLCD